MSLKCTANAGSPPLWQKHRIQFLIEPSVPDTVWPVPLLGQVEAALADCEFLRKQDLRMETAISKTILKTLYQENTVKTGMVESGQRHMLA